MNLYEKGHLMEKDQLERAIDGLIGATSQMVKLRKNETQEELTIQNHKGLYKKSCKTSNLDGVSL
jgi:hypothetical protein